MIKKICLYAIVVLSMLVFEKICWAETVKLLSMSGLKTKNVSRISLAFDKIPTFEIKESGQRVEIILAKTIVDPSFTKMPPDEIIFRIETSENFHETIVDLYLRKIPGFVDVTVDKERALLNVNIFLDQKRKGRRPAILQQRLGDMKMSTDGSIAQKVISSQYSERWIEFFRDYEWPVNIDFPLTFTFSPFPSSPALDHLTSSSQPLLQEGIDVLCENAERGLNEYGVEDTYSDIAIYALISAECLLQDHQYKEALDVLNLVDQDNSNESLIGWLRYCQSYALALSGKYYTAMNFLTSRKEWFLNENGQASWFRILQAELELAGGKPGQVLEILDSETQMDADLQWIYNLRKADALYQLGQFDDACDVYQNAVSDMDSLRNHPFSLANRADVLYQKKEFSEAYRHYFLLHSLVKNKFSEQSELVNYRLAMAMMRSGEVETAKLILSEIVKSDGGSEAGLRSRLKLMDLDILSGTPVQLSRILMEYDDIIESAMIRDIREEAFFKKILACHVFGEDLRAIKFLGPFFDEYWAGPLHSEAQALFVDIFPRVVGELVEQDASLVALSLVAKHRNLLAQAAINDDFLTNLADSYRQMGFWDQAEATYLFMLDVEKNKDTDRNVLFSLIEIYYQQNKYEQVQNYASMYLNAYPEGGEGAMVLYYYADALFKQGNIETAVTFLIDKDRPKTQELDRLAGNIFFELGQYDLVEYYFSRAFSEDPDDEHPEITLKRAESLFFTQNWQRAIPFYESLLDKPNFMGQAAYRLILIFNELGHEKRAFKLNSKIAETETEKQWLKLAEETVKTRKLLTIGN